MKVSPNLNILIVEDDGDMRVLIKNLLRKKGLKNVNSVNDGNEALAALNEAESKQEPVELLLVDWHTPGMDGLELLKQVKAHESFKFIPFAMLTADGERDHVLEALSLGVDDYIMKPIVVDVLLNKIWALMGAGEV